MLVISWLLLRQLPSSHTIASLLTLSKPSQSPPTPLTHTLSPRTGADVCKLLPHYLSTLLVLPLVQLLSQPASALQQLDHVHYMSENHSAARSLLTHIQESCLAGRRRTVPAASSMPGVVHGNLSHMASVVQQYMYMQADPVLVEGWLKDTPLGSADSVELVTLVAASLATCFSDKADILKPVLLAFGHLAKASPCLVSLSICVSIGDLHCTIDTFYSSFSPPPAKFHS